jgi:hypothetical protein
MNIKNSRNQFWSDIGLDESDIGRNQTGIGKWK